jgi:hypothetical protein
MSDAPMNRPQDDEQPANNSGRRAHRPEVVIWLAVMAALALFIAVGVSSLIMAA